MVENIITEAPGFDSRRKRVRRRLSRFSGRIDPGFRMELLFGIAAVAGGVLGYLVLGGRVEFGNDGPMGRTLLLLMIVLPLMGLSILVARRISLVLLRRREGLTGARMHARLVGLFAGLAAVPTLLVVVFASLLFQTGTQFWFSDRAQTVLINAEEVAQAYVEENRDRILADSIATGGDLAQYANEYGIEEQLFADGLSWQLAARNLDEAVVFRLSAGERLQLIAESAGADGLGPTRVLSERLSDDVLERAATGEAVILNGRSDRVEAVVRVGAPGGAYLYASRAVDPGAVQAADRAAGARSEYATLLANSRDLQWRFNVLLGAVAILVIAAAILSALWLANRLTAPIARLADAASRLGEGDLAARVPVRGNPDELASLARTFNQMARQLENQTDALITANAAAEERRGFVEAVMKGVSAGVVSVASDGRIEFVSAAAEGLLQLDEPSLLGQRLGEAVPHFADLFSRAVQTGSAQGEVGIDRDGEAQILLVNALAVPGGAHGYVLTFDDVNQRLSDQRRAAWADVARRIAHEIKNPLTPIQLSAERLQRRFGDQLEADDELFRKLTGTIVRQVGDLRRMVDEFSSFARMPKPVFREESLREIVRQAMFLQEVGNADISYRLDAPKDLPPFICDHRQISQALTNLMKNAAEALAGGEGVPPTEAPEIDVKLALTDDILTLSVCDNGPGLPEHLRDRVTEPYVTTRTKGTGLGLAIVSKIVEDHGGTMTIDGGCGEASGACFEMRFDLATTLEVDSAGQDMDAVTAGGN
ncbi:MAG: ATP-binding protein [Pseudomonadota bacterium]